MKDNTKITLTVGQLRKLVKEWSGHDPDMSTVAKNLRRNLSYDFYWNMKSTGGDTTPEIKRDEVDKYVPEDFWTKLAETAVNDGADKATDMFVDLFLQNYDKIVGGKFYFEKTLRINVKREIERATAELFRFRDQPKNEKELIAKLDKEIADAKSSGVQLPPQWVLDEYAGEFNHEIKRYIDGRRDGGGIEYGWGIKDYGTGKWSKWVKDNWWNILYLMPKEVENILKYRRGDVATEFGERIVEVLTGLVDKRNILLTSVNSKDRVDDMVDYLNDCCAPSEPANLYARVDGGSNYDGYPSSYVGDDEREQKARASADKLVKGINDQLAKRPFNGKTLTVTNVGTKYTKVRTRVDNGDDGQEWYAYPIALKLTYGDGSPVEDETKINENSKITLTIGQLKRLVKESLDGDFAKILSTACKSIKFEAIDLVDYFDGWYKAEEAGDKKEALIYLRQIKNAGANIDQLLDDIRNLNIGDTPAISGWKGGPVTEDGDASAAFDISGAIMAGNLKFEGLNDSKRWRSMMAPSDAGRVAFGGKPRAAVGAPSPLNAKLFDVCLFQQDGDGWLNLDLHFDMGHIAVKYFRSKNKNENPWANYRRSMGEPMRIDEQLANDIKNNADLLRALKEYVEYNAPSNNDPAGNNARKMQEMLDKYNGVGPYIDAWNDMIDRSDQKKQADASFKDLQDWADKEYGSHKFGYYSEYYRGPNVPAHDDDYEGSGSISPSEIVKQLGLHSEEEIKKAFEQMISGTGITHVRDHWRTFYRCTD